MRDEDTRLPSRLAPSTAERERTIALLSDRFAQGDLDMDAFEERVTIAHRARTSDELAALTADLNVPVPATAEAPQTQLIIASETPAQGQAIAIFGGAQRTGRWRMPRRLHVVAVFGGVEIDLRNAELPAGAFEMDVRATFGGVQILVPPSLAVEVHGSGIFGGFAHMDRVPPSPDPGAPVLHVHGSAVFGGVSVETRLEGESQRAAHRRQRKQLRDQRREQRHRRRLGGQDG